MSEKAEVDQLDSELRLLRQDQERAKESTDRTEERLTTLIQKYHEMKAQNEKLCEKEQLDELRSELQMLEKRQDQAELFEPIIRRHIKHLSDMHHQFKQESAVICKKGEAVVARLGLDLRHQSQALGAHKQTTSEQMAWLISQPWLAAQEKAKSDDKAQIARLQSELRLLRRQIDEERASTTTTKKQIDELSESIDTVNERYTWQHDEAKRTRKALGAAVISDLRGQLSCQKIADEQIKALVLQNKK